jgi:membrane protein
MGRIKRKTYKLKNFFRNDIWEMELEELSKAKARFIKYVKVMLITIKTFADEKIGFQAVALSFFSTMSVVPFIAIMFAITGGLGLSDKLKELLYAYFNNSQQTIDTILRFADNIIQNAQSSAMGLVSSMMFAFIVIWMMLNVEKVFNNVWKVRKSRNIFKRLSFIFALVILSPFVVMVFFAGSFIYSHALDYLGLDYAGLTAFKTLLTWLSFAIIVSLTLSAMYKFIPKFKVEYGVAFRAALFAAVAFTGMQFLYLETQLLVTRLNGVYGTFAAIPLFMVWLNISWNIILMGAELSYAFQHVDNYNLDD